VDSGPLTKNFVHAADGTVRWIWARGFPVPSEERARWLFGTTGHKSRKQRDEIVNNSMLWKQHELKQRHSANQLWPKPELSDGLGLDTAVALHFPIGSFDRARCYSSKTDLT